ncbi:MAG: carboxypeptidase regulatory-like domain-containing protein, partial [Candidatus Micrarchaeota archaeon]
MPFPAFLVKAYFSAEDLYYKAADLLQKKLHVPVYKYYVDPIENTGTPSFPVTLAIIAAILFSLGIVVAGAPKIAFQVTVMHGSIPLEGATVTLSGGTYFAELETDENGQVLFEDIPEGTELSLAAGKEGYRSKQATVTVKKEGTTVRLYREGEAEPGEGGLVSVAVVATDEEGAPLAGASISYSFDNQGDAGAANAEGKYSFSALQGAEVAVTVSKTGFQTASDSFTASEGFVKTIALRPLSADPRLALRGTGLPVPRDGVNTEGSGDTEYSGVTVEVRGKNGVNYSSASVRLYNAFNDARINEATARPNQPASFGQIAVGTEVYAIASATGFSTNKSRNVVVTRSQTRIVLEITNLTQLFYNSTTGEWCYADGRCIHLNEETGEYEDENGTEIDEETLASLGVSLDVYAVDNSTGQAVANAQVILQDADGAPLHEERANAAGKASFEDLVIGSSFTVFASKTDYFPYWSPAPFEAGSAPNYTARLVKGDENNSGSLAAHVYAIQGTGTVDLATVKVTLRVNGTRWTEEKETNRSGIALFYPLPIGAEVIADATIEEFVATNSTVIQRGSNAVDLLALTPQYNLAVEVRDYMRNRTMAARVKVYWPDASSEANLVSECSTTATANCRFTLYTKRSYEIKAEASVFPTVLRRYTESNAAARQANLTIEMIPRTGNIVQYMGLFYEDGTQKAPGEPIPPRFCIDGGCPTSDVAVYGSWAFELWPTEKYYAKFLVFLQNNTQETVLYVRAGETSRDILSDNAAILKMFTHLGGSVFDPSLFDSVKGSKGTGCPSPIPAQEDGLYKWVEARISAENYSGADAIEVNVPIITTSDRHNQFTLYYRAAARVNDSAYVTEPLDEAFTPSTESSKRCTAKANTANFTKPDAVDYGFACSQKGCIKTRYEQEDRRGGAFFQVNIPYLAEGAPLAINYTVTDFSPPPAYSETVDKFVYSPISKARLTYLNPSNLEAEGEDSWRYEIQMGGPHASGDDTYIPNWEDESHAVLTDGQETISFYLKSEPPATQTALQTQVLFSYAKQATPPQSTYVVRFNSGTQKLEMFRADDTAYAHALNEIPLTASPVFPADAVYLRLDASSLPSDCRATELSHTPFTVVKTPRATGCFEYERTTGLLKYDASASKTACEAYSKDPNFVNSAAVNLTVSPDCIGPVYSKTITLNITADNTYPALYFVPAWQLGYYGLHASNAVMLFQDPFNGEVLPHILNDLQLLLLVNNRQYGPLEPIVIQYGDALF